MSTPINEIFNEQAIAQQTKRVLDQLQAVATAIRDVKAAVDGSKVSAADAAVAKRAAAIEAANQRAAAAATKRAAEEEKLAAAVAKRAAAELQLAKAQGTAASGLSEIDRLTRLYDEGMKKLNGTLTTEAEKLAQVRVANAEVSKQLKQQAREVLGLSGAYDKLQQEYQQAKVAAQNLGAQLGVTSNEYKAAAASAIALNNQLKAIDGGIGNFQRNVGNYASGFQNFTQVLREMPNFAISATVGVQSLSNNIPMLVAEIQSARAASQSWGTIMKGLGAQLISFQSVAILAVTALTMLPSILKDMGAEAKKAEDEMRSFFEGITSEQTKLSTLFTVAKDVNQQMEIRNDAVKQLRDQYGNYLKNLTDEQIKAGDTAEAYKALAEAIVMSARAKAASDKISKLQAEQLMAEEKMISIIADSEKKRADAVLLRKQRESMSLTQRERMAPIDTDEQIRQAARKELEAVSKGITDRSKEITRLTQTVLDNQVKPFTDGDKDSKKKSKEYFNEQAQLRVSDLELQNVYLKAIMDSENATYDQRLLAAKKFASNESQILDIQLQDDLDRNKFNLKNKEDAKNEEAILNADYRVNQAKLEIDHLQFISSIQKKIAEDIAKEKERLDAENKKNLEDNEKAWETNYTQTVLEFEKKRNEALIALNERFIADKTMSVADYEKEKLAIETEYTKQSTDAQIAALERLLDMTWISADRRKEIEKEITDLKLKGLKIVADARAKDAKAEDKDNRTRLQKLEAYLRDVNRAVNTITSTINELGQAAFEKTQAELESQRTAIEKNAAAELKRINDSTLSEQQKADQIIILEARKQAQLEENDRKRRKLEQERARFERLNSIANIVSGTALAVVSALGAKPFSPLNIVLAATIGALGAAQLARAIATPIPKYKMGTQHHKGGLAIVGDGGKSERVILPGGEQFDTPNKSTLVNLPKGAKVLPDAALADRLMKNNMPRRVQVKSESKDEALMIWQTRELAKAFAKNKPKVSTKVNVNLGRDIWLHKNVFE